MFTLSQTGLEKAVGKRCLVINSPLCTGRIWGFCFVPVTDLGTSGPEQHALIEKVICMLMYFTSWACPLATLCVAHSSSSLKLECEATRFVFDNTNCGKKQQWPRTESWQTTLSSCQWHQAKAHFQNTSGAWCTFGPLQRLTQRG